MAEPEKIRKSKAGRKKGVPNKRSLEVEARLLAMGCDPIVGMARIAAGDTPCPECHAKGRQKYSMGMAGPYVDVDGGTERTCCLCHGTKKEPIPAKLAGEMLRELAQYVASKRKAIEHSGEIKQPPAISVTIEGVSDAPAPPPAAG